LTNFWLGWKFFRNKKHQMAQKLSATVEIGAALSGSFGKSFATAENYIKQFGSSLSAVRQAENDIRSLISAETALQEAQRKNSAELREYGKLLRLKNMKRSAEATEKFNANLEAQKRKVDQARAALDKQQGTVRKLGETLRSAGVDTKDLSGEMERLAKKSLLTRERMKMLGSLKELNLGPMASRILPALMVRFPAFGKAMQSMAPSIAGALPILGAVSVAVAAVAAAFVAAAYGAFRLGKAFSDFVDDNQDAAEGLGLSVKNLIELRFAAGDAGIEAAKFDQQLAKLSNSLQSAVDGSKEQKRAFEELGLDATTLQTMNLEEQFKAVAEGFKNYKGNVSKAALAHDLFGKGSTRLLGVLNKGEAGLNSYAQRVADSGLVPSDADMKKAQDFDRQWNDFNNTIIGLRNTIAAPLLEGLGDGMRAIGNWIRENKTFIAEFGEATGKMVKTLGNELPIILTLMGKMAWITLKIVEGFNWIAEKSQKIGETIGGFFYEQNYKPGQNNNFSSGLGSNSGFYVPRLPAPGTGSNTTNNSNRTINVTVNAAPGMNERSLADYTVEEIDRMSVEQGLLHDVK
jgi:hypothetical protein